MEENGKKEGVVSLSLSLSLSLFSLVLNGKYETGRLIYGFIDDRVLLLSSPVLVP